MVYQGCDEEYAEQVTAEHKINVKNGRRVQEEWVTKKSHADNHYLDAEVYAMAAADVLGVRTIHLENVGHTDNPEPKQERHAPEEEWIKANEKWV